MPFTVATYNVLASAYIKPEWYAGVPPHFLDPAWRVPAVARSVAALDTDLVCLQEVEPDVFATVTSHLETLGYVGLYERKGRDRPDGCAVFLRTAVFTLRTSRRLEYRDCEGGPEIHSGSVALLAALERDGRMLGVASTHVKWAAPGTPRDAHIGHRQVAELIEACRGFGPPCHDWVVCGDFNYTPDDEVIGVMRDAGFAFAHADRPDVRRHWEGEADRLRVPHRRAAFPAVRPAGDRRRRQTALAGPAVRPPAARRRTRLDRPLRRFRLISWAGCRRSRGASRCGRSSRRR